MVTIGISLWPAESAKKVGKCFLEMPPYPDFIEVIGPFNIADVGSGITSIIIYKYDKEKAGEAYEALSRVYVSFFDVPGLTYSLKNASDIPSSFKMLGLA